MKALPEGTVTFLFTDIEGSTRLWEEYGASMQSALAQHDSLMRREIEAVGGTVFKTMGDAFCAVFPNSKAAVQAAVNAQIALHSEQWPDGITLKVRMAVHTGIAELRDHDYFGTTLNRSARILATAHGGQIILSEVTYSLCSDEQNAGISFLSLGLHHLKDLEKPEHIYQLCHADLPSEFPPLRSLSINTHNLPVQITSFVGREKEKLSLMEMLSCSRLVTLAGSGGFGKTRLALQTAAELLEEFPQGVWLIEMAPVTDPSQVPQTVANVLGVREEPGTPLITKLCTFLTARKTLIILDNCEHLLDAVSQLADMLLKQCPHISILATSREGLGVPGEQVFRIPSLSTPPMSGAAYSQLEQYESVQLFVERARLHQPEFAITPDNAASVGAVCARLDGIPLAIELASARVRTMTVEEIEKRLDQRFRLLTGGSRTVLPRQQTLRQLIDWSYDLLNDRERSMLQSVSVFMGGWSLECAERVCSNEDIEDWEVLDLLSSLSDKSLISIETVTDMALGNITRYRLLETIRQYSLEKLTEAGAVARARCRHRDWFVSYAENASKYMHGKDEVLWITRLTREHENLQSALDWCWDEGEHGNIHGTETGLKLAGLLEIYWGICGHWRQGLLKLEALFSQPLQGVSKEYLCSALKCAGRLAIGINNSNASDYYNQALALSRELGDKPGEASILGNLGIVSLEGGDFMSARNYLETALVMNRETGNRRLEGFNLRNLGLIAMMTGDLGVAREFCESALSIEKQIGNQQGMAVTLNNLGMIAQNTGDYTGAREYYEQALASAMELGHKLGVSVNLGILGNVASDIGDYAAARDYFDRALAINRELGHQIAEAGCLLNIGITEQETGDLPMAHAHYDQALSIYRELNNRLGQAEVLLAQGILEMRESQYVHAKQLLQEVIAIGLELKLTPILIQPIEASGSLFCATTCFKLAAQLLGAAQSARKILQVPLPPSKVAGVERDHEACRIALGNAEYERCITEGASLTLEEAAKLVLSN